MPTQISRTIAREILVMFLISLTVLTAIVMFIGVAREAINQGIGVQTTLRLIPYLVPNALAISIPGTMLFSICYVFGRMSAANEITALHAVGISPAATLRPALLIAVALSFVTVGVVNIAFTWGHEGVERVFLSSAQQIAIRKLSEDRRYQTGNLSISVQSVEDSRLIRPVIHVRQKRGASVNIKAKNATLSYSSEDKGLTFSFTDGTADLGDQASFRFPDTFSHTVSLHHESDQNALTSNPSHMSMADLPRAEVQLQQDIHKRSSAVAVHTAMNILASRFDSLADKTATQRTNAIQQGHQRMHRLGAERHRRWSSGFTCFALAIVGIPLAVRLRTSDVMTTFGVCFLPTLLVYYPLFALTLDMAKDGRLPGWSVWIANYVFISSGMLMIRKCLYS